MARFVCHLVRDTYSRDMGTFGTLSVLEQGEKIFECHTVERAWANNTPNISCIPEGEYPLNPRRYYRKNYDAWEVCDVPNRSFILIHIANTPSDLEGCIGVGDERGWLNGGWAVRNSGRAFGRFMEVMKAAVNGDRASAILQVSQYRPYYDGGP